MWHVRGTGDVQTETLVGRPDGRRPLGRPWRRWVYNIKMDIQKVGWGMDWINLALYKDTWRALAPAVMNLWIPQNARNFLTS